MVRMLCAFFAASLGLAQVAVAAESPLQQRVAELERIIRSQQEELVASQAEFEKTQALIEGVNDANAANANRRLTATLPPSIHGGEAGKYRDYTAAENTAGAMNHMWLILCGALVMFMQAGFAMVESGACRAKNVQNILLKNLTDVCMGTLGWWFSGWAFAYSDGISENKFMGYGSFFGTGFLVTRDDKQIEPTSTMLAWFFQWAFCSAAATIVSGGVAERCNFYAYCIYSFFMTAFIYPIVVAWTWGYGWLMSMNTVGYMDFAGSGIVHMTGGIGALVGAAIAGPRAGRWTNPEAFDPHSLPLIVLGTFILWFGWYGFNCGSTLGMADVATGMMAAQVAMNTTIAAATGGLVVFSLRLAMTKKYDIGGFCNGILAGLVSITAPCGNVECGSAFGIAILGGLIYQGASSLLKLLKIDDPIDAFAVHGACGAWGTFAAALFDWGEGFDHYHGWSGFACVMDNGSCAKGVAGEGIAANITEIVTIALWVAAFSAIIFAPLRFVGFLRASDELQEQGFDTAKHSPPKAYAMDAPEQGNAPSSLSA